MYTYTYIYREGTSARGGGGGGVIRARIGTRNTNVKERSRNVELTYCKRPPRGRPRREISYDARSRMYVQHICTYVCTYIGMYVRGIKICKIYAAAFESSPRQE